VLKQNSCYLYWRWYNESTEKEGIMSTKSNTIIENRKARHEYHLEETLVAGIALEGWEVKSLRAGKVSLTEGFIVIHQGEAYLHQVTITPLPSASSHITTEPARARKLLLNKKEISRLIGAVERDGRTLVPLTLFWQKNFVKISLALAKGKKLHDKREDEKARDWAREKARALKGA